MSIDKGSANLPQRHHHLLHVTGGAVKAKVGTSPGAKGWGLVSGKQPYMDPKLLFSATMKKKQTIQEL